MNGIVGTSIKLLCETIGYIPNRSEGKINEKIIKSLKWLEERKHISIMTDINKLEINDCFLIKINNDNNIYNFDKDYVILTEKEFNIITTYVLKGRRNRENLLNVYLNIKKFMSFDKDNIPLCYPSHTTLCRDCNISSKGTINNIISCLVDMGLLYIYNSGRFEDSNGNIKYANNFYALEEGVLKPEMCDDIMKNYYLNQGVIIKKFIK